MYVTTVRDTEHRQTCLGLLASQPGQMPSTPGLVRDLLTCLKRVRSPHVLLCPLNWHTHTYFKNIISTKTNIDHVFSLSYQTIQSSCRFVLKVSEIKLYTITILLTLKSSLKSTFAISITSYRCH